MNDIIGLIELFIKIDTNGDPALEAIRWNAIATALIVLATVGLGFLFRSLKSLRVTNSRDSAESSLYSQLEQRLKIQEEQINSLQGSLEAARLTHADLVLKNAQAMVRIEKVEQYESVINELKQALSRKEKMLEDKDADLRKERDHNRELTTEISRLKDRVAELEARLSKDEAHLRRIHSENIGTGAGYG